MTMDRLADFGAASRAGDVDWLMSFMAGECVFRASVGTGPGTVFQGRDEVRRGFELMLAYDEGAEAHGGLAFIAGGGPRSGPTPPPWPTERSSKSRDVTCRSSPAT